MITANFNKYFLWSFFILISIETKAQLMKNAFWEVPPSFKSYKYEQWYRDDERDFPYVYLTKENEILQFNLIDNSIKIHSFTFEDHIIVDEIDFFLIGRKNKKIVVYDSKKDKTKETDYESLDCFYQYNNGFLCKGKKENSDTTYYVSLVTELEYFYKVTKPLSYKITGNQVALSSGKEIKIFDFEGNLISTINENILIKENNMLAFPKSPFFHFSPKGDYTYEGIISKEGKIVTEYFLNSVSPKLIGDYYVINKDKIFNNDGKKVNSSTFIPTSIENILVKPYCNDEYYPELYTIKFLNNGKTIPCDVEDFRVDLENSIIRIKRNNKATLEYYNDKGNLLIETEKPVAIYKLNEKTYTINQNGNYKIVNNSGVQLLSKVFKNGPIYYFGDYLVVFDEDSGLLLFDKKWNQIFQHKDVTNLLNIVGGYVIYQDKWNKNRMLPLKDKPHLPFQFSEINGGGYFTEKNNRFITLCDNSDCYLMDIKKNRIYSDRFDYLFLIDENHLLARKDNLYGIIKLEIR